MIERSIVEALHRAQKGSKQELQAKALEAVFAAVKADGFQDISPQTPEVPKVYPEIALKQEWTRQAQKLANLFAKELNFSTPEEYMATLPRFDLQPKEYKGRLDIPVIVETRVPLKRMLALAGIDTYFDVDLIKDWEKGRFRTPKAPYITWLNDGSANLNKSVANVRVALRSDERGGTDFDGIALYLKDPKILEHHFLDLPGSQVGSGSAPYLGHWDGRPRLDRLFVDDANPRYGSVVAGIKIKV